ncbi:TRAP transporter substrate-binding protein [Paludifilum halophilum]|uniref:TRAP transporter substrate-binding protein n=1 Tax=Paludifilum halophilum TaxID=1642702 RepID=UPI001F0B5BDE|nr:TRAP transporter substrate-binding protein [Paludifilum halophilum]
MKRVGLLLWGLVILSITACSASNADPSGAQNGNEGIGERHLTLAHIHGEASPVYGSLEEFGEDLERRSEGKINVDIYGEAVLGDERVMLELVKTGVIDMAKVNGGVLESFSSDFSVFSLPYVFKDDEHYRRVMQSGTVQDLYKDLQNVGLMGITHYNAGTRSFYTKNTPINHPDDLRGLKIRVMNNTTSIETMELLGASPTPLPPSEVYTGLQQGIIDGAESSPIALTDANHGEVAKTFSFDEHTRIPDFLVMNADTWNRLSEEEKQMIQKSARKSTKYHAEKWEKLLQRSMEESKKELGVRFYHPEQEPFRKKVEPLIQEARREDPDIAKILDRFKELE